MKRIGFYHQCHGCNQITEITSLNPWTKYYVMPIFICNGVDCYNQQMYTVWLYDRDGGKGRRMKLLGDS